MEDAVEDRKNVVSGAHAATGTRPGGGQPWWSHTTALLGVLLALGVGFVLAGLLAQGEEMWRTVVVDAGFCLVTVAIVGLLLDASMTQLRGRLDSRATRSTARGATTRTEGGQGLAGMREEVDLVQLLKDLRPGQELWWMDTFPLTFAGDLDAIHRALLSGVRIRLLVLEPRSPSLTYRLREIRHHYGLSPMDLRRSFDTLCSQLRVLAEVDASVVDNLEVRAYDGLPGAPMYLVLGDDQADGERRGEVLRALSSYYLLDASQDMPYIEWRAGAFADRLRGYFEHQWNGAHVVFPLENGERKVSAVHTANVPTTQRIAGGVPGS